MTVGVGVDMSVLRAAGQQGQESLSYVFRDGGRNYPGETQGARVMPNHHCRSASRALSLLLTVN